MDEAYAVSLDNRRGAVLLFLLAFGSQEWLASNSLHFLPQIHHEIVWDWTSLYFNCHHFKSQACRGVTDSIYRGPGATQSCEMSRLYEVLILFKTPIHLQINIWGPHIPLHQFCTRCNPLLPRRTDQIIHCKTRLIVMLARRALGQLFERSWRYIYTVKSIQGRAA